MARFNLKGGNRLIPQCVFRAGILFCGALLALIALGGASQASGQAMNSGDITGTVTDSTGAVVPGVAVTVLDVDKNQSHSFVTNDAGAYDTGPIIPDHYLLTFTKDGFATYKRGPLTIGVGMLGINVQMTVGQTSQQVVVTSDAPLLETTTAEVSSTLEEQTLQELPQIGGNYADWSSFVALQPGATGSPQVFFGGALGEGTEASANGSLPYFTGLMDGAYITSPMSDNVIMNPMFDSIAEVKMSDSLFSAQNGMGGVLYNQITRGGSDHYHGSAFDYLENTVFNAASYSFGTGVVPPVHRHDVGGTIGGPLPIPHLDKRMFLFFGAEGVVNHGGSSVAFINVPTNAMRTGDFTGLASIYDPTTQTVNAGVVTRQTFASEYGNGNKIPTALLDPVAKNIQAVFPTENTGSAVPVNDYSYIAQGSKFPVVKYFGRFDLDLTSNNRLTGSSAWQNGWPVSVTPVGTVNADGFDILSTLTQLTDVWTISSKLVNEFRFGFMEEHDKWTPESLNGGWPAKLGLQYMKADEFPAVTINSIYGLSPSTNGYYTSNVLTPSDAVTLVLGRHDIHFGGEDLIYRSDSTQGNLTAYGAVNPAALAFTGVYTAGSNQSGNPLTTTTGSPYADFLLGYVNSWSALVSPEFGAREKTPQLFAQDDWKFNQNLTLNLGVRWAGTTGWSDIKGNVDSFDPTVTNPATNKPGAMWYATTHANGRTHLQKAIWDEFMPRLGFAYALGAKTTIRGGWGIYTFPWSYDDYGLGLGYAFASSGSEADNTGGVQPVAFLKGTGNENPQGSAGASINSRYVTAPTGPDSYNGQGVSYQQYDNPFVQLQQWNLTVQRELASNLMGQLSYIGSHGGNELYLTDINQVPQSKLGPNDAASRPYPEFQTISGNTPNAISNYHSLQAVITQRMTEGLQFSFNYVWSKFLDDQDTAGWNLVQGNEPFQNAYVPSSNYGPSNFDVRHAFKGEVVYQLPFGKGRHFLNNSAALDEAIGGWEISETNVIQTGSPFTATMATNLSDSLSSNASQYPNLVGNPKASGSSGKLTEWFNVAAFASPGAAAFGNARRNSLYGPGLKAFNLALHKVFPIYKERTTLDLSINAQNFPNHPSFGLPDSSIGPGHTAQIFSTTVGGRSIQWVAKLRF